MDEFLLNEIQLMKENGENFQSIRNLGEERLKEFFNLIYPRFSLPEIEALVGIPDSTLERWFNKLNIPLTRNHKYSISFPSFEDGQVVVEKNGRAIIIQNVEITPELAYVIGFALGDGSIQKYTVEVFNKDRKLREYLYRFLEPYGSITEDEREYGLWRLRLSNGRIANLIKDKKRIRKDTIDFIFNDEELARRFIAAFWDAEGTVRRKKNYFNIYLYNCNNYLIKRIGGFLESKGMKVSILRRKRNIKGCNLRGRLIKSKKVLKRISIPKSDFLKWVSQIGVYLLHSKKSEVVKEIKEIYGGSQNE